MLLLLCRAEEKVVPARGKALISTGLVIAVPEGTYGRVAPRSGLGESGSIRFNAYSYSLPIVLETDMSCIFIALSASKYMIDTGAGVIDEDYRGEVFVLLFNHAESDYTVTAGDRIAQLVLERIATPEVTEVQSMEDTVRGAGGFGSSGK